jgi:hypothetical protein
METAEILLDANKQVRVHMNAEKTVYMIIHLHQSAGQNNDIKTPIKYFGTVGI